MPRRKLPPLNALAIFEEVAVRRSCSEAALHLGLTQSAGSKTGAGDGALHRRTTFLAHKGACATMRGGRLLSDVQPILDAMDAS